ncbi:MAG: polyprenyl diphosphate synthase, partial [Beijerinckiaceae bacterium]
MTPGSAILQVPVAEPASGAGAPPPRHVAIIMDGNGRWAARRGLPRFEGHRRGVEAVRRTVKAAIELGIGHLTIFSFSTENWSRPAAEIAELMGLLRRFIRNDLADLHAQNVRVRIIGEKEGVSDDIQRLLVEAETVTAANAGLVLTIAFNYGGRVEIARAARKLAADAAAGLIRPDDITEKTLGAALSTADVPDPDLLIRT